MTFAKLQNMKTMQQYWVTKKSVSRKFGGKEDECIVSSDAELDAKLELFRSIADSCVQLQKVIDIYQERLCYLAQEENALGRYLKECGKKEKNAAAGQLMTISGKSLAYTGHQRLTMRSPLVRLHHEVETFRGRAVSDTRVTIVEMEKARTEYRAALSWMKSASAQLDPDTGNGLDKFRKAQSYVRTTKVRFDRLMLACLQKVDLLAAARCNMFSHALVGYQKAVSTFSNKSYDTMLVGLSRLQCIEPGDLSVLSELSATNEETDKDKQTFFNADFTDQKDSKNVSDNSKPDDDCQQPKRNDDLLLGEDFFNVVEAHEKVKESASLDSSDLLGLSWPTSPPVNNSSGDLFASTSNFMPSNLIQQDFNEALNSSENPSNFKSASKLTKLTNLEDSSKKSSQMTWLSLFADLDPLAQENNLADESSGDRA